MLFSRSVDLQAVRYIPRLGIGKFDFFAMRLQPDENESGAGKRKLGNN